MRLGMGKTIVFVLTCGIIVGAGELTAEASTLDAGVFSTISSYMTRENVSVSDSNVAETTSGQTEDDSLTYGYTNLGIANIEEGNLNVREEASTDSNLVGKMPKNAGCEILGQEGDWYHIKSGKVEGYVSGEFILTGDEAKAMAEEVKTTIATVTTQTLNVRAEMNTECAKLALMPEGEELVVLEDYGDWVAIDLDGETGYVSTDYVDISVQLPKAMTMTEVRYGQGVSDVRVAVVSYATQFVGNPYVWGGTSLTNGADCSGFVMSVMAHYGISLPHSSRSQANCGTRINASQAQPGDLFFYGKGRSINHVAIYIGNGQVVHASSPSTGIKISNAYYRSPICVVRVIND
ncbi:MAG: NlpC/P60 family protein [Roseburia sp.]